MPTTRRKSGNNPTSSAAQSTLSFHNKPTRVTKPTSDSTSTKKASSKLTEPAETQLTKEVKPLTLISSSPPPKAAAATPKRKSVKKATTETDSYTSALQTASKISDAQIKKYWKEEESSRIAPRVHQTTLPLPEKILRHFDLSSQFGPCIGIPRLRRWQRAHNLGLAPPVEVLAVLVRGEEQGEKGKAKVKEMAYIDELGGGRMVGVGGGD